MNTRKQARYTHLVRHVDRDGLCGSWQRVCVLHEVGVAIEESREGQDAKEQLAMVSICGKEGTCAIHTAERLGFQQHVERILVAHTLLLRHGGHAKMKGRRGTLRADCFEMRRSGEGIRSTRHSFARHFRHDVCSPWR
eukprot:scaffold142650_cov32-Tisochrysis_lutea.AAC.4